ncbi:MAG: hypothetical protein OEY36_07075 [Gammaproteobacteria bacterium]|nr:hypothetical protein [Gammaproteobacteria bacterium]
MKKSTYYLLNCILLASTAAFAEPVTHTIDQHSTASNTELEMEKTRITELKLQLEQTNAAVSELRELFKKLHTKSHPAVEWEGYGVINYSQYDFFRNVQDTVPDRRSKVDLERLILEPKFKLSETMMFEAELEIEHGGTGSTVEYEAAEFGEYELELEKGGEVVVEKAQLEIHSSAAINWHIGHIVVPFGMINRYTKPTDYFTASRSLGEAALIPNTWHETGVELYGKAAVFNYRALVVNGLDSSGFSSQNWVAGGYQTRMEFANADDLAIVAVLDYPLANHGLIGAAMYAGNSASNRHQQNLAVSANVNIWEIHARYQQGPWIVRSQVMAGTVENSDLITDANKNLVNQGVRGISATPVGHAAEAAYIEAAYNLLHSGTVNGRLDLFIRYDEFDTMAAVEGTIQDNLRYQRNSTTLGLNYKPLPNIVFKAELAEHQHAGEIANQFDHFALGLGVTF